MRDSLKGWEQIFGGIYTPVIEYTKRSMLLVLLVQRVFKRLQVDLNFELQNENMEEECYIPQPEGLEVMGQ